MKFMQLKDLRLVKRMKKPVSHYMITKHLLEWIKATTVSKTIALLVHKTIMANLHNHVKLNKMKRV